MCVCVIFPRDSSVSCLSSLLLRRVPTALGDLLTFSLAFSRKRTSRNSLPPVLSLAHLPLHFLGHDARACVSHSVDAVRDEATRARDSPRLISL